MCQKAHFGGGKNLGPLVTECTHGGGRYSYQNKPPSLGSPCIMIIYLPPLGIVVLNARIW